MSLDKKILHIIPAAGKATRFGGIPKFLLPLSKDNFLIKYHASDLAIKDINIKKVIATSSENFDTLKRMHLDVELIEIESQTMNETVIEVIDSYPEYDDYLLTMPDTYFFDNNLLYNLFTKYIENEKTCSVGLFEIQDYQRGKLGQCKLNKDSVERVIDKDINCTFKHAWGLIMWNKKFNKFINPNDPHIGYIINPIIKDKVDVSFSISSSLYYDCGTFDEYKKLLNDLTE